MNEVLVVAKRGLSNACRLFLSLAKVIIPIYIGVELLQVTGIMTWIGRWLAPLMSLIGLPGEAAVALVFGAATGVYGMMGAIAALGLTVKQITIISGFVLVCHSLFIEGAIMGKSGLNPLLATLIRFVAALVLAVILNLLL